MPRCRVVPEVRHRWRVLIDGRDVTAWNFDPQDPRPCFYPVVGPGGAGLTRMGHPGAPDHDHHRSIWFAHNLVLGVNFWADGTGARISQSQWLAIEDGDDRAAFAVDLAWADGHNPTPLLKQQLIAVIHRDVDSDWQLEIQSTFETVGGTVELMQTNFGIFAVRVAKSLSAAFGGGRLRCSEGRSGEPAIFEQSARWVDYSGPIEPEKMPLSATSSQIEAAQPAALQAGITYFDHPQNRSYPSRWHVRDDGWMTASICQQAGIVIDQTTPLMVRYQLDLHQDELNAERAERLATRFNQSPAWQVVPSTRPHTRFEIVSRT